MMLNYDLMRFMMTKINTRGVTAPVQVHFEEESPPRHLITFHMYVGGKPTSK